MIVDKLGKLFEDRRKVNEEVKVDRRKKEQQKKTVDNKKAKK